MYGQDLHGPTAVLASVSRIPSLLAGNGTLLNMKFLPSFFQTEKDREKFSSFLKAFVRMPIHHVQFNVVRAETLREAQADPDAYRDLIVRVAGYSDYFCDLGTALLATLLVELGQILVVTFVLEVKLGFDLMHFDILLVERLLDRLLNTAH